MNEKVFFGNRSIRELIFERNPESFHKPFSVSATSQRLLNQGSKVDYQKTFLDFTLWNTDFQFLRLTLHRFFEYPEHD
jgi:hypothetical protein